MLLSIIKLVIIKIIIGVVNITNVMQAKIIKYITLKRLSN